MCSYPELTKDHVLTRNAVNKNLRRKKDCSWLPLNKHAMNIWLSSLRIRAHLSWRTGKHLHVLHVLRTFTPRARIPDTRIPQLMQPCRGVSPPLADIVLPKNLAALGVTPSPPSWTKSTKQYLKASHMHANPELIMILRVGHNIFRRPCQQHSSGGRSPFIDCYWYVVEHYSTF